MSIRLEEVLVRVVAASEELALSQYPQVEAILRDLEADVAQALHEVGEAGA
jgi:hypothetical protein